MVQEKILVTSAADIKTGGRRALCHVRKENSLAVSASSPWSPNLLTTAWDLELTPQLAPTPCSQSSVLLLTSLLLESKAFRKALIPFSTDPQGHRIQRLQQGLFTSIHKPSACRTGLNFSSGNCSDMYHFQAFYPAVFWTLFCLLPTPCPTLCEHVEG